MSIFDRYDNAMKDALIDSYKNAEASMGYRTTTELPAGKYQGYITRMKFIENTKDFDDPHDMCDHMLMLEVCVIGGQYDNCLVAKWYPMSINGIARMKPDLITLGYELKSLEGLEEQVESGKLLDMIIDFNVTHKHKGEKTYVNIWIDRNTGKKYSPIGGVSKSESGGGGWKPANEEKLPWEK